MNHCQQEPADSRPIHQHPELFDEDEDDADQNESTPLAPDSPEVAGTAAARLKKKNQNLMATTNYLSREPFPSDYRLEEAAPLSFEQHQKVK